MKTSILILASLFSLAIATPLVDRQGCSCNYFCIGEKFCECEIEAKNKCYKKQLAGGLDCPPPKYSENCAPQAILPVTTPTPTPTPEPKRRDQARSDPEDPCACDFYCLTQVGPDCECEIKNKNECHARQVQAGLQCPAPVITERCQTYSILPISVSPPRPTPSTLPPGSEGEWCGITRGLPQERKCKAGLFCKQPRCADCLGKCVRRES